MLSQPKTITIGTRTELRHAISAYEAALTELRQVEAQAPHDDDHAAGLAFERGPLEVARRAVFAAWHQIEALVKSLDGVAVIHRGELYPVLNVEAIEDVFRPAGGFKSRQIINLDREPAPRRTSSRHPDIVDVIGRFETARNAAIVAIDHDETERHEDEAERLYEVLGELLHAGGFVAVNLNGMTYNSRRLVGDQRDMANVYGAEVYRSTLVLDLDA